jgi:hypothetical protein
MIYMLIVFQRKVPLVPKDQVTVPAFLMKLYLSVARQRALVLENRPYLALAIDDHFHGFRAVKRA